MKNSPDSLKHNIRLLYIQSLFNNSDFTLPIYILFGRQFLGLNYLEAGSFLIVSWSFSVALDFAGGSIADKIGRRRAYLYGTALQIIAFAPFLFTKSYSFLLAVSAVYGAGKALSSNSIDALLYEQAISLKAKNTYRYANANAQVFIFIGRIYASVLGGVLFTIHPRLPYLFLILAMTIALTAGARMRLPEQVQITNTLSYRQTIRAALKAYKLNLAILKFVIVAALFALWADMLFGYLQPFFLQHHVSSAQLGILFSIISLVSMIGSYLMKRLPIFLHANTIQSLELAGSAASAILMYTLHLPLLFAAPLLVALAFGVMNPNIRLYINGHTQNHLRASVLSVASMMSNLGSLLGFGLAFFMADRYSQHFILAIVGFGSVVTLGLNVLVKIDEPGRLPPVPS